MSQDPQFRKSAQTGHAAFSRRRALEAWTLGLSFALPIAVLAIAIGMLLRYQAVGGWLVPAFAIAAVGAGIWIGVNFLRRHSLRYPQFLRHLEQRLRLEENELVNADELEARIPTIDDPLSRGLAQHAVSRGASKLDRIEYPKLAPSISLRSSLWRAASALAVAVLLFVLSPDGFRSSSARILRPGTTELPPALLIRVEPGDATVERGTTVRVKATLPEKQQEARLHYRGLGGAWRTLDMNQATAGSDASTFDGQLAEIGEVTEYAVSAGSARSEVYRLNVIDPLRAVGYQKRIEPPAYTRMPPEQEMAADGNMSALTGSRLSLGVESSLPKATGRLVFDDGSTVPLQATEPGHLSAAFPLRRSGDYHVELASAEVNSNWKSETFHLDAVPDRPPTLYQLAPERSIQMPSDMAVTIEADCLDDFGLTRLDLVWKRNDEGAERLNLARWQGSREERTSNPWELEAILRAPGDVVHYHLELVDNDPVTGPKTTLGPECEITFPSLEEMYDAVNNDREEQQASTAEMLQDQKQLRQDLEKARMDLKQSSQMGWQQQEQLKQLSERQDQVMNQLDQLAQSLDQSMAKMQQSNSFSPEMLQKVQEIGDLVRQIADPNFKKQMERLQEAMQKLDRNEIDKALQELAQNQEQMEKNLDRTLELLKQLVAEEKLDQMIQQAEKLLENQKDINQELGGDKADSTQAKSDQADAQEQEQNKDGDQKQSPSGEQKENQNQQKKDGAQNPADKQNQMSKQESEQLQKKQQELAKELAKLQEEMKKLREEEEKRLQELQATKESKPEQQLSQASEKMQSASQSMQQCNKSGSLKFGRQAEKKLEQFAQQMRQAQANAKSQQNDQIVKRLFALSNQLVNISKSQESLMQAAPARPTRELAAEQSRLADGAKKTLDELYEVARTSRLLSPELGRTMGEATRELESAARALEEGDRSGAMMQGRSSSNSLNQTVLALLNASNQQQSSCSSGSCSNPMSSLRGLSGQQQSLNQDTQQMMGGQSGSRLSPGGSSGEALAQMAARQEMIRKGLQEVQNALGNRSDVLGRLDDLGKEMDDIVEQMRSKDVDSRILKRQERILSRLLTAQRSLRKEDYKDERVSKTGQNPDNMESPAAVQAELTRQDLLKRGILRGSQDPVPADYRALVEQYFRTLSEKP